MQSEFQLFGMLISCKYLSTDPIRKQRTTHRSLYSYSMQDFRAGREVYAIFDLKDIDCLYVKFHRVKKKLKLTKNKKLLEAS